MKFIEIEKLTEKIPNKYMAIVLASKEARKIIEVRKPVAAQAVETPPDTAVPEIEAKEEPVVKKRGRKSKKEIMETSSVIESDQTPVQTSKKEVSEQDDLVSLEFTTDKKIKSVSVGKIEENPYIAALKKVAKNFDFTEKSSNKTEVE